MDICVQIMAEPDYDEMGNLISNRVVSVPLRSQKAFDWCLPEVLGPHETLEKLQVSFMIAFEKSGGVP